MLVLIASCTPSIATPDDPRLARLLEDRQAIWQAWFTNDRSRLELLLPNSVIAITNGDTTWQDRSAVLAAAATFPSCTRPTSRSWNRRAASPYYAAGLQRSSSGGTACGKMPAGIWMRGAETGQISPNRTRRVSCSCPVGRVSDS